MTASEQRSVYSKEYLDELKRGQMNSPRGGTAVVAAATTSSGFDDLTKSKFGADQLQGEKTGFFFEDSLQGFWPELNGSVCARRLDRIAVVSTD